MKDIVFTDLDGSLLDASTYSYTEALDALNLLRNKQIPLIFCSAKTRFEQEVYRKAMAITAPFIVENEGAIFISEDYFPFAFHHDKTVDNYMVI
ncbi:HAD hydrolase family protein [Chloroflexota bacterium]